MRSCSRAGPGSESLLGELGDRARDLWTQLLKVICRLLEANNWFMSSPRRQSLQQMVFYDSLDFIILNLPQINFDKIKRQRGRTITYFLKSFSSTVIIRLHNLSKFNYIVNRELYSKRWCWELCNNNFYIILGKYRNFMNFFFFYKGFSITRISVQDKVLLQLI